MKRALILFAIATILFATACKKDNNDPEPKYNYRLTKMTEMREGLNDLNITFLYEDDRIVGWEDIDGAGSEFDVKINYLENNVVETVRYSDVGSTIISEKINYTFKGELIVKVEDYLKKDGSLTLNNQTIYSYNQNGDVIETVQSEFIDGVEMPLHKTINNYDKGTLSETINYQWIQEKWGKFSKTSYQYEGSLLILSVYYAFSNEAWIPFYKEEFMRAVNENEELYISKVKQSLFVSEDEWDWFLTRTYQYDNNRNIRVEEVTSSSSNNYKTVYTYEEKPGNLWIFKFNNTYGYPNPFYEPQQDILFGLKDFKRVTE